MWGRWAARWTQELLRSPSQWTPGQRELMTSFIASRLGCVF